MRDEVQERVAEQSTRREAEQDLQARPVLCGVVERYEEQDQHRRSADQTGGAERLNPEPESGIPSALRAGGVWFVASVLFYVSRFADVVIAVPVRVSVSAAVVTVPVTSFFRDLIDVMDVVTVTVMADRLAVTVTVSSGRLVTVTVTAARGLVVTVAVPGGSCRRWFGFVGMLMPVSAAAGMRLLLLTWLVGRL